MTKYGFTRAIQIAPTGCNQSFPFDYESDWQSSTILIPSVLTPIWFLSLVRLQLRVVPSHMTPTSTMKPMTMAASPWCLRSAAAGPWAGSPCAAGGALNGCRQVAAVVAPCRPPGGTMTTWAPAAVRHLHRPAGEDVGAAGPGTFPFPHHHHPEEGKKAFVKYTYAHAYTPTQKASEYIFKNTPGRLQWQLYCYFP